MPGGWTNPVQVFNAVTLTSTVQYGAIDLRSVLTDHVGQGSVTYVSGDIWTVSLHGSLDSVNWYDLGYLMTGGPAGASGSATTMGLYLTKPCRYLRAAGHNAGSGAAIITVWLASRE